MQSANLSGPLKGLRPHQALLGPTQASGLAGGFDLGHIAVTEAVVKELQLLLQNKFQTGDRVHHGLHRLVGLQNGLGSEILKR